MNVLLQFVFYATYETQFARFCYVPCRASVRIFGGSLLCDSLFSLLHQNTISLFLPARKSLSSRTQNSTLWL